MVLTLMSPFRAFSMLLHHTLQPFILRTVHLVMYKEPATILVYTSSTMRLASRAIPGQQAEATAKLTRHVLQPQLKQ